MSGIQVYSDYQGLSKSEKIGLVVLEASKRLMGWVADVGSIYKLTSVDFSVIVSLEDSGVGYAAAASYAALSASTYFLDRNAKTLYVWAAGGVNPNSLFIGLIYRLFFSNVGGVYQPNDLSTGFAVEWVPLLSASSSFGVSLDTHYQLGVAIEGSGSVSFFNDQTFWANRYDKVYFENQRVFIYSWNRALPITEAKIIYRGRIESKQFDETMVTFNLKDFLNELRAPVPLSLISAVAGVRAPSNILAAKQRLLYGYVYGNRPTNIDQVLTSYPLTGTIALTNGSLSIVGTGTTFLNDLSPNDELFFGTYAKAFVVKDVTDDLNATLTQAFDSLTVSGQAYSIRPKLPKNYMNRKFIIAGHALREPVTTVTAADSLSEVTVASMQDIQAGDALVVGAENTTVKRITPVKIQFTTTLLNVPAIGATVTRPAISQVQIGNRTLVLNRDYTYSAAFGTLTLTKTAEFNVAPIQAISGTLTFTSGSRTVTGSGTFFKAELVPGSWLLGNGQSVWVQVLAVDSDTSLRVRVAATYTQTDIAYAKNPEYYNEGKTVLSCDVLGVTIDGTTTGNMIVKAPQVVKDLLIRAGLSSSISASTFTTAESTSEHRVSLVIPAVFSDSKVPTLRDSITAINQSVFGSLIQGRDFLLEYTIFDPEKPASMSTLHEGDILSFKIDSKSDNMAKKINVNYKKKEYDPIAGGPIYSTATATSDAAQYLAKTIKETTIEAALSDDSSATIFAARYAMISEIASSVVKFQTKLQGARLQVNDRVEIRHRKFYTRLGSTSTHKIAAVQSASKSISDSDIELDDLANAFSRVACITATGALDYSQASENDKSVNGYITDTYGMQSNDPNSVGVNLQW